MRWAFVLAIKNITEFRQAYEFGCAIARRGYNGEVVSPEDRTAENLNKFDVVMEINMARPEWLRRDAIHIAWVQDYVKESSTYYSNTSDPCPPFEAAAGARDLIYTFGDPYAMGIEEQWPHWAGSLVSGVNPMLLDRPSSSAADQDLDFSICGYIPQSLERIPSTNDPTTLKVIRMVCEVVADYCRPLSGTMCAQECMATMRRRIPLSEEDWRVNAVFFGRVMREAARLQDRQVAARLILSLSQAVEFRGSNWDTHAEFARWAKPHTADHVTLLALYQRSRINVHTNVFGFGMHSRVLEAMAVGGFIMANKSRWVGKAGMMDEAFEPGVHFGEYDADTFCERARYWLADSAARMKVVDEALKVVKAHHLWDNRADQVLRDLGVGSRRAVNF